MRKLAHASLRQRAERKAQHVELLARGREQEIALVTVAVVRTEKRAAAVRRTAVNHVVPGGQDAAAKLARGIEQISELDGPVALDARDRRLARRIALGEAVDHRFLEARLVVEHVMRNAEPLGDHPRVMDVAPGAARALAV